MFRESSEGIKICRRYTVAMGSLPRTFLFVATHKNFSALLIRPIFLNGCPYSFSIPPSPQK